MFNGSRAVIELKPHIDIVKGLSEFFVEENIFEEPFIEPWLKVTITVVFVLTACLCSILIGTAVFEWAGLMDPCRTVINQLVSVMNVLAATYVGFTMTIDVIRMWVGPLPILVCDLNLLMRSIPINCLAIVFAQITIFKFLFICVWKTIPLMNDDILAKFCTWFALVIGSLIGLAKYFLPGRLVFNQVYCYGVYYQSFEEVTRKTQLESFLFLPVLAVVIILSILIAITNHEAKRQENIQTCRNDKRGLRINLASLTANFVCLAEITLTNIFIIELNKSIPQQWGAFPFNMYSVTYRFFFPCIAAFTFVLFQAKSLKLVFVKNVKN